VASALPIAVRSLCCSAAFPGLVAIRFAYGLPSTGEVQPTGNGSSTGSPPVWPTIGEDAILEMAFQEPFENLKRDTQIDTKYRAAGRLPPCK